VAVTTETKVMAVILTEVTAEATKAMAAARVMAAATARIMTTITATTAQAITAATTSGKAMTRIQTMVQAVIPTAATKAQKMRTGMMKALMAILAHTPVVHQEEVPMAAAIQDHGIAEGIHLKAEEMADLP